MDIGQAKIAALEFVSEPAVIHAEQVKQRRLKIVDVHATLDRVETKIVGFAAGEPGPRALRSRDRAGSKLKIVVRGNSGQTKA